MAADEAQLQSPLPTDLPTLSYVHSPLGYYLRIGRRFSIQNRWWIGDAIVGREAIYLLKRMPYSRGIAEHGFIGGLIVSATADMHDPPDDIHSCTYLQLPEQVRFHPDWPTKQ